MGRRVGLARPFATALLAAAAVGACGAPIPSGQTVPTPLGVPTAPSAPAVTLPPASPRALASAPYAIETMRPAFSIFLPEGFVLQRLASDQFVISHGPDPGGAGIAIVRPSASDLVGAVMRTPGFTTPSLVDVQIGSLLGRSAVFGVMQDRTEPPVVFWSADFATPFVLPLGARGRVIEFTAANGPVVMLYWAPEAEFGTFEAIAQGALASFALR